MAYFISIWSGFIKFEYKSIQTRIKFQRIQPNFTESDLIYWIGLF